MSGGSGKGDIASFATAVAGGKGDGVWVSLRKHRAFGDGHDKLFGFESIEGSAFRDTLIGNRQGNVIDGGPGDDHLIGGGGPDTLDRRPGQRRLQGSQGPHRLLRQGKGAESLRLRPARPGRRRRRPACRSSAAAARTTSASPSTKPPRPSSVTAAKGLAIGPGCSRPPQVANQVTCPAVGPGRWLMADLGPGNDKLRIEGSMLAVGSVRLAGGYGNDVIHGGPEDDLIESGPGSDRLYGGAGADGLVGGLPGPDLPLRRSQRRPAGGRRRLRRRRPGRRPRSRRRLLRRDPGAPRPALHLLPSPRGLDRRDQGLSPSPPLAHRRGHGGLLRQRRPDRQLSAPTACSASPAKTSSSATAATT